MLPRTASGSVYRDDRPVHLPAHEELKQAVAAGKPAPVGLNDAALDSEMAYDRARHHRIIVAPVSSARTPSSF
jgi:hypothetical protein